MQPNFALLTFMFLYLPSPHMMSLYMTKASASVLNIVWGFIFLIGGLLAIFLFNEIIGWREGEIIELVFCLAPLGFYCMLCGLGNIGKIKSKEHLSSPEKLKYSLRLLCTLKTLAYPLLFFFSPLIGLVIYLRAICRHNQIFANDYTECKYIECLAETSPQLCLQLFVLLKTYHYKPSVQLWLSIIMGIFTVGVPPNTKFLHHSKQPYRFLNKIKYYPIFFFNSVFRIFSWSIIFVYFLFFYGVCIMITQIGLLTLINYLIMRAFFPDLVKDRSDRKEYRFQVGEMAIQNFLTIPNLQDTKAARFCRKFSFYTSLIVNILLLLVLLLLNNLDFKKIHTCLIFTCEDNQVLSFHHNEHNFFNEVVSAVISVGLFGLLLDLIYAKFSAAVFNIPVANSNIIANDISRILSGKVNSKTNEDDYE